MKLILCKECGDVVRLVTEEIRYCLCGKCSGRYKDNLNAWYKGKNAIPLGVENQSLISAVYRQPQEGMGTQFNAFVIPVVCKTFEKIDDET
jgi:endogenous inhibitor of DNA gyrase (YacG/DUF329 family)